MYAAPLPQRSGAQARLLVLRARLQRPCLASPDWLFAASLRAPFTPNQP